MKYDDLISDLKSKGLSEDDFFKILKEIDPYTEPRIHLELLISQGVPITLRDGIYYLATKLKPYKDETFCIVDIETNGSKAPLNQIIEIGAIKYRGGEIIDKFHSMVYSNSVPEYIVKITNIRVDDLKDAPVAEDVLKKFREFLADSVFVAHNVKFDYAFISIWLNTVGLGRLYNRALCSIDLAKKTIDADKFGLANLKELLNIDTTLHRAFEDAIATTKVFEIALKSVPESVLTTEDLIEFSRFNKKEKK